MLLAMGQAWSPPTSKTLSPQAQDSSSVQPLVCEGIHPADLHRPPMRHDECPGELPQLGAPEACGALMKAFVSDPNPSVSDSWLLPTSRK